MEVKETNPVVLSVLFLMSLLSLCFLIFLFALFLSTVCAQTSSWVSVMALPSTENGTMNLLWIRRCHLSRQNPLTSGLAGPTPVAMRRTPVEGRAGEATGWAMISTPTASMDFTCGQVSIVIIHCSCSMRKTLLIIVVLQNCNHVQ